MGHETQVSVADVPFKYLPATQAVQVSEGLEPMISYQAAIPTDSLLCENLEASPRNVT